MSSPRSIRVGFAPFDLRYTFWAIATQAVKSLASARGISLSTVAVAGDRSVVTILEEFIEQGVDAAIIMPAFDHPTFVPTVQRALNRNIRVIVLDSAISQAVNTIHVRPDNMAGAMLATEHLFKKMGGRGNLAHLQGDPGSHSALMRVQGVHTVVERYPAVKIVFEASGDWSRASGSRLMREALAAHPDLDGVICGNDLMALGAFDAMTALGLATPLPTVGFDAQSEALRAIYNGGMTATIWQDPAHMGRVALDVALQVVAGANVPRETVTDVALVTADNVVPIAFQTIDLLPTVLEDLVASTESQHQLQQGIIAAQERAIRELSTPIIPITDEIMVMPLIGSIDSNRAEQIMEAMLMAVGDRHAQAVILDITGVAVIDTVTANYLLQASRAVQLLGAQVVLVGISPEIAQTIVQLGIDLEGLLTRSTLQSGLEYTLKYLVRGSRLRL
jgi:anti-anti-sigma factor